MASLDPHTGVLGKRLARHLIRRASFVYTKDMINEFAAYTPQQALNKLFEDNPLTVEKPYLYVNDGGSPIGYYTDTTNENQPEAGRKRSFTKGWWWYNAINDPSIKYKLTYFLHTRLTSELVTGGGGIMYFQHLKLLMRYAYGSYKDLAYKITWDGSMAVYLDNRSNRKQAPNENYAREFLELFTIGKGEQLSDTDYTTYREHDVVTAARVLTGFRWSSLGYADTNGHIDPDTGLYTCFKQWSWHDTNNKTFSDAFGQYMVTAAADESGMDAELQDFVDMIFDKQDTARHLARKLYQYFVNRNITDEIENDIIEPLSLTLYNNNYELEIAVRELLESQHFYDLDDSDSTDNTIGSMTKSPLQIVSEICTYLHCELPDLNVDIHNNSTDFYEYFWRRFLDDIYFTTSDQGLFQPGSVAGHPAYHQSPGFDRNWLSSSTLLSRYKVGESILDGRNRLTPTNQFDIRARINIAAVIRDNNLVSNPSNSFTLVKELLEDLFGEEPDTTRINFFKNEFLQVGLTDLEWQQMWNDFEGGGPDTAVTPRLTSLLANILRAPESQPF